MGGGEGGRRSLLLSRRSETLSDRTPEKSQRKSTLSIMSDLQDLQFPGFRPQRTSGSVLSRNVRHLGTGQCRNGVLSRLLPSCGQRPPSAFRTPPGLK